MRVFKLLFSKGKKDGLEYKEIEGARLNFKFRFD